MSGKHEGEKPGPSVDTLAKVSLAVSVAGLAVDAAALASSVGLFAASQDAEVTE